jgi:hypothetical protein
LDCSEARVVVPKELRDGILFVHHYSRLACHASWLDMMDQIQEAGYTWRGLGHSCKQMTGRCMECMQAKRAHSDHEHTYAEYAARKAGTATTPTA